MRIWMLPNYTQIFFMKPLFFVLVSFIYFNAAAQDKVIMNDKNVVLRDLGEFKGINIKGPFKVYYSQSAKHAVGVSASTESARDKITTRVSAGILNIELDGASMSWWGKNPEFKVYISSPEKSIFPRTPRRYNSLVSSEYCASQSISVMSFSKNFSFSRGRYAFTIV